MAAEDELFAEMCLGDIAVEEARDKGNYKPLIERLRSAKVLLLTERETAADIIAGDLKRPPHRRAASPEAVRFMDTYIALSARVLADKGWPRKAAVPEVARAMRISETKVRTAIKNNPDLTHPSWQ